jgi:hypothetical protein
MSTHSNTTKLLQSLQGIQRGIAEVLTTGKTMSFRQSTIDGPGLLALITPLLATIQKVGDEKTAWKQAVAAKKAIEASAEQLVTDVRKGADSSFSETSVEFEQFGFTPRKTAASLTPEQKQLKVARARATRAARGTLGSRQRRSVKGNVTAPETPPTTGQGGSTAKP